LILKIKRKGVTWQSSLTEQFWISTTTAVEGGNRTEVERWLYTANKLLSTRDLHSARSFAIHARESDPTFDACEHLLDVIALSSSENHGSTTTTVIGTEFFNILTSNIDQHRWPVSPTCSALRPYSEPICFLQPPFLPCLCLVCSLKSC